MKLTFTLIALSFYCLLNAQKAGTLDSSFGSNGIVYNKDHGIIYKIALQSDGKIITAGDGIINKHGFVLARYNTDGTIDSSFGEDGHAGNGELNIAFSMTVQNDNKIVAFGHDTYLKLARYNRDGSLDTTFGDAGIVNTTVGLGADVPVDIESEPDGKLVVGGYIINQPNEDRQGYLVRYLDNGDLDESFGDNGKVIFTTPDENSSINIISAIALAPNRKIAVLVNYISSLQSRVYRFNNDGTVDNSFGMGGIATFQSITDSFNTFHATDIVIEPDGKIAGCGTVSIDNNDFKGNMSTARLREDGSIDTGFGKNGIAYVAKNATYGKSILLQNDGKLISCGGESLLNYTKDYFALVRFTSIGNIDSTFGDNGIQTTQTIKSHSAISSSVLQKNGEILCGGSSGETDILARYNNDDKSKKQIIIQKIKHYIQTHNDAQATTLNRVSIYPNPVQNILHVEGLSANAKLTVVDFAGNIKLQAIANASSYNLNIAALYAGSYLLKIETNGEVVTKQFVKE